ncbi:sensor histidine kinase [Listeria booriae]|uniref:histidine kinase n=1 Tax=Listeria booriae TaxID=1552123 RepID=A0A841XP37_9LIST|nr:sensor histidine kinase [Listeria booriae]MBC1316914.1 sensor histidine kinase [Listeria booriae]
MGTKQRLNYVIEDKILAELLGEQNFSTKESAILELVKNAYDANATKVELILKKTNQGNCLIINDDGEGMDEPIIKKAWMHVGKTSRGYENQENSRVYAGAKGIGRFALARLGEEVELQSKRAGAESIVWKTNWRESVLEIKENTINQGTTFYISRLRDKWSRRTLNPLVSYLSKVYNDSAMKIILNFENEEQTVPKLWTDPRIGENYVSSLKMNYVAEKQILNYEIEIDEFNETVRSTMGIEYENKVSSEINANDELKQKITELLFEMELDKNLEIDSLDKEVAQVLQTLGDFKAEFYFSLSSINQKDYDWFQYKHKNLTDRYESGIILYRNAFSIDSFEGRQDWLKLSKRAAASPAAASHPVGKWRVRANQLAGYVVIDKERNNMIKDLSNRQGIVENLHFKVLNLVILLGLSEFEMYRQSIIRQINAYQKKIEEGIHSEQKDRKEAEIIVEKLKKNHENIRNLSKEDVDIVISEFDRKKSENEYIKRERDEFEKSAKYEVQLLNVLATSHLKIISLGHEIHNDRNNISSVPHDLEEAIRSLEIWEELCDDSLPFYRNIPELLISLGGNTEKILTLTDSILEETEKKNFENKEHNIEEIMEVILDKWRQQYKWITIEIEIIGDTRVIISYDQLFVIFNNLILNSIQQNDKMQSLTIKIKLNRVDNIIRIEYQDNGIGLDKKYQNNTKRILEVHESNRDKGHGLGMWIVNNTIIKLRGEIEEITGHDGFTLSAFIKIEEDLNGKRN